MSFVTYILLGAALMATAVFFKERYVSFWAQKSDDYADGPIFDIRERFNGPILCEGVIYGPTGKVSTRIVAKYEGSSKGNEGRKQEVF